MDEHGIKSERIRRLKNSRAGIKGVVSKKCGELLTIMKDAGNVEKVRKKVLELESSMRDFTCAHNKRKIEGFGEKGSLSGRSAQFTGNASYPSYLVQYTVGDVRQLMRGCLPMKPEEGYETARLLLKNRYQGYKIATAYVERLTKVQPEGSEDGSTLQTFSVMLTSCENALKEIGYQSNIENPCKR